jgi:hypothetical protein
MHNPHPDTSRAAAERKMMLFVWKGVTVGVEKDVKVSEQLTGQSAAIRTQRVVCGPKLLRSINCQKANLA